MILDRAVEKVATVNLRGAGINPSNLPYISCSLEPTNPQQQGDKVTSLYRLLYYNSSNKIIIPLGFISYCEYYECILCTLHLPSKNITFRHYMHHMEWPGGFVCCADNLSSACMGEIENNRSLTQWASCWAPLWLSSQGEPSFQCSLLLHPF
jgi:hypothetical protein